MLAALIEGLFDLAFLIVDHWSRKSTRRRKVFLAVLLMVLTPLLVLVSGAGFYLALFADTTGTRVAGALLGALGLGSFAYLSHTVLRLHRSTAGG
jgi:hypothetical protein